MARHRRHRRSYRGITSISLGNLPVSLDDNVKVMDALAGAAVGLVVAGVVKAGLSAYAPGVYAQIATVAGPAIPLITGVAAGALLFYAQGKSARAKGHLVGSVLAGTAMTVASLLPKLNGIIPGVNFSDVVSLNLSGMGNYRGLIVADNSDSQFNGLIVADKSDSLNELAAMSMGDDDAMSLGGY